MGNDEKIAKNKRHNAPFVEAFDYVAKLKNLNQGQLAKVLKTSNSHISAYRSGDKRVSTMMMDRLIDASGGCVSKYYLLGLSQDLFKNTPDDGHDETSYQDAPDTSSTVNAALASRDMLIDELRQKLAEKDETIAFLKQQIGVKDKQISELIAKSGQIIAQQFPFGIGSAETLEINK